MRLILLLGFIVPFFGNLYAQGWLSQGARSGALANSGVSLVDVFAFHHNPGALGFIENGVVGLSYESRYALKELQSQSVAVAVPLKRGVISAGGQFYGYDAYRTTKAGIGYSMKLSEKISAGVQINYLGMHFGSTYYGRKNGVSAELGALAKLTDQLDLGFSVVNLNRSKLSDYKNERYGTILRLGLSYKILEDLTLISEIEHEVAYNPRLRGAIEYHPIDILYIRLGVQGAPMDFAFGFGIAYEWFKFDLSAQYNQQLGWTPAASFLIDFYRPKK